MAGRSESAEALAAILDAAMLAAEAEGICAEAAKRIGARICEQIQREFGTERLYVPARSKTERDRAVLIALNSGESPQSIANRLNLHPSTVHRIRQRRQAKQGMGPSEWVLR